MLVFLLDCLRFSKLQEILTSIWCNFSNLVIYQNANNPVEKQLCTAGFTHLMTLYDLIFSRQIKIF